MTRWLLLTLALALPAEDWPSILADCARRFDRHEADAALWHAYARAALETGDQRLAAALIEGALLRFPDLAELRRLELAVLARSGRAEALAMAADAWLGAHPDDALVWRQRAWAADRQGDRAGACAALEAALLLEPDDRALRRQLAGLQSALGLHRAALAHWRLLAGDAACCLAAATAAGEAGEPALGRRWLREHPAQLSGRDGRLLEARLAIQAGDDEAAGDALQALIAGGERDGRILAWAGHLAERRGDAALAESLYVQAGETGILRLAHLLHRTRRDGEALRLLEGREDAAAAALRQALRPGPLAPGP